MLGRKNIIGLMVMALFINSCITGDNTLKCYSRLVSDSAIVRKAIFVFWDKHPENRLDEVTIQKIENHFPNMFNGNKTFIDSSNCYKCRSALRSYVHFGDFEREEWYVKSSNGQMVFRLEIANIGAWINGFTCDLCLRYVLYLNESEKNFRNKELSKDRKKQAKKVFEEDILPKLR